MSLLPDTATLFAFALSCIVLAVTPGPDMSLTLSRTLSAGRRAGIATVLGTNLGIVGHTLAAAFGVSALIAASATAFTALKVAGALYLAWLAVDAIRRGSALNVRPETAKQSADVWTAFWLGVTMNLTNPKVVLFFVTFLPQFVRADDPNPTGKLLVLGLSFVLMNLPFGIALVYGAERVTGTLRARPRILRGIDWLFAGIFGALAARILATAR